MKTILFWQTSNSKALLKLSQLEITALIASLLLVILIWESSSRALKSGQEKYNAAEKEALLSHQKSAVTFHFEIQVSPPPGSFNPLGTPIWSRQWI